MMFRLGLSHTSRKTQTIISRRWLSSGISIQEEIRDANESFKDRIVVKDAGERGWGVYADRDYAVGEVVVQARGLETSNLQTTHTIQSGWESHVFMDLPARFINHRCESPNLGIKPNKCGAYDFIALKSIEAEEEMVWDYESTEYEFGFDCSCGAPKCRGHLKGFRHHGDAVIESFGEEFVAPYLLSPKDQKSKDDMAA